MALLSRIFQSRKNARNSPFTWNQSDQRKKCNRPAFDKNDIRLVVFRDHELKGKSLLFDSKGLTSPSNQTQCGAKKRPAPAKDGKTGNTADSTCQNQQKSKQRRQLSDINTLGEMMFGSVAMSYKGSSLKVHSIRTPSQLMVTKVFLPSMHRESTGEQESFDNYSIQSTSSEGTAPKHINGMEKPGFSIAHSVPMDVPSPPSKKAEPDLEELLENEDSGISASVASSSSGFTPYHSPGSSSASINSNSFNSLQRRFIRSKTKSLEYSLRNRHSEEPPSEPASKRVPRFGIGIIISQCEDDEEATKHFQQFFFSHITLIESHIQKLRTSTEKALVCTRSASKFSALIVDALSVFRDSVHDLYTTPRLPEPVWLNMMCYSTHRVALCQQFLKEFMVLTDKFDTKTTKFFVSTLITAVLTHHLAWVPTVTPAGATPSRSYMDKHSAKWLDTLAKSHPYNPLWAQLGDMYGAIGFPLRHSRTIVTGKNASVVQKFLYMLSYFIRCSELVENSEIQDVFDADEDSPAVDMLPIMEQSDTGDSRRTSVIETSQSELESSSSSVGIFGSVSTCDTCTSDSTVINTKSMQAQFTNFASEEVEHCETCAANQAVSSSSSDVIPQSNSSFDAKCTCAGKRVFQKGVRPGIRPLLLFRTLKDHSAVDAGGAETEATEAEHSQPADDVNADDEDDFLNLERIDSGLCDSIESNAENDRSSNVSPSFHHQISPHVIAESPKRLQERHVGRMSFLDPVDGLPALPEGAVQHCAPLKVRTLRSSDVAATVPCEVCRSDSSSSDRSQVSVREASLLSPSQDMFTSQKSNGSQASDVTLTGDPVSDDPCPRSPVVMRQKDTDADTKEAIHDRFINDSGVYVNMEGQKTKGDSESSQTPVLPTNFSFSRSSSMFDEYVNDDTIEVLPPSVQQFKRMASIEGSNSVFDEYMEESFSDADQFRKLAMEHCRNPRDKAGLTTENSAESSIARLMENSVEIPAKLKHRPDTLCFRTRTGSGASLLNRQNSNQSAGRCRSITPTEGRRRHMSSASIESVDPFLNLNEVPMPEFESREEPESLLQYSRNFGRSLLASHSDHYLSDFVLHGTNDASYLPKLHSDLSTSVQSSVLDESIAEAACIVADTDKWTVRLLSCQYHTADRLNTQELQASQLVCNMVEAVQQLAKLKMSPEFCLMHLEDRLQEIYFKSKMLSEYLRIHKKMNTSELANLLGFDESDLPLLLAVAGTHSAHLAMGLI